MQDSTVLKLKPSGCLSKNKPENLQEAPTGCPVCSFCIWGFCFVFLQVKCPETTARWSGVSAPTASTCTASWSGWTRSRSSSSVPCAGRSGSSRSDPRLRQSHFDARVSVFSRRFGNKRGNLAHVLNGEPSRQAAREVVLLLIEFSNSHGSFFLFPTTTRKKRPSVGWCQTVKTFTL